MKNIMDREELYTTVEIEGKGTFRIKKFTAKEGLKMARLLIAKAAPLIPVLDGGDDNTGFMDDPAVFEAIGKVLESLDDKDLDMLTDRCLRVCSKLMPAGPQEVIDEYGNYGVEEVEYDFGLTLRLIVEAVKWGASDFFGEKGSGLKSLMGRIGKQRNQ